MAVKSRIHFPVVLDPKEGPQTLKTLCTVCCSTYKTPFRRSV